MKGILIGGGVGPMAGVELHRKIINNTKTNGSDQDHLDIVHISFSSLINDRSRFLLEGDENNPGEIMADLVLSSCGVFGIPGNGAVAAVPCNTFHAEKIFSVYSDKINKSGKDIKIVNMIEETVLYLKSHFPENSKIALMSTTGTRKTGIYSDYLSKAGFSLVEVDEEDQGNLHNIIYNNNWGIKAISPVTQEAKEKAYYYASKLIQKGACCIILGCTEFPLALSSPDIEGVPLVDPVYVLAKALIREAAPEKLL
jgi:aspartate racemase